VQGMRASKRKRFCHELALVLLTITVLCFTVSPAGAQETSAPQTPGTAATQTPTQPAPAQQSAAPAQPPAERGVETVHIIVGHSLLIRTPVRIRRILTGNPDVVDTVLTSPDELVVTAKKPGSSSLMLWDEGGRNRTLDVYADLDVAALRSTLEQSFPNTNVDVQSQGGKLTLVGTVPTKEVADQMIKMSDNFTKEVVNGLQIAPPPHLRQLMLKVRFAEADRSKLSQWGFNLVSTGATNTIGTISTQQYSPLTLQQTGGSGSGSSSGVGNQFTISDLLNIFIFRPDINLGATIRFLQQKNVLQILAEPNLMALSGQPAHFLAGGEFPYPVVQSVGTAGSSGAITIQFRPYGVKLEFVGTISDSGTIHLKVAPEVSSLDYANAVTLSGFTMPAIQTRRAETEIELKDGQSFGIAGLLDERTTMILNKIPGIGDVPILGELFKSRSINKTNSELVVLVTPTIVDPVMGNVPTSPEVHPPVKNLDKGDFDKGLPTPVNPGTK
jgi:pilus assembly protein CpaC